MELGFDPTSLLRLKPIQKMGVAFGILLIIALGYWQFFFKNLQASIETLNTDIAKQTENIKNKKIQLTQLPKLRQELAELNILEAQAARKLPSKKEIPALLTDISNAGHEQGLTFLLFAPKSELPAEIHTEVPVELKIQGPYHETALFMQTIASMPRIVTISNLQMTPDKNGVLQTLAQATTYRFLDADEMAAQEKKNKAAKPAAKAAGKPAAKPAAKEKGDK